MDLGENDLANGIEIDCQCGCKLECGCDRRDEMSKKQTEALERIMEAALGFMDGHGLVEFTNYEWIYKEAQKSLNQ